ncbi:MAG: dienelactone hydrolase family protein [Acidobacteria bacterium]|nr:dienelactone hydrolase family protein [Acidobacteriota bacterium]
MAKKIICASLLCLACFGRAAAQKNENPPEKASNSLMDWSSPDRIDPRSATAGDFLDIDLGHYDGLGRQAYLQGKYWQAARYYLFVLRHKYDDPRVIYNLACCYGLLGEGELAAHTLARAVDAGFSDLERIRMDKDFDKVRNSEAFARLLRNLTPYIEDMGETFLVAAPALQKCRLKLPAGYDDEKAYPLVIGLHGYLDSVDNFIRLWNGVTGADLIYVTPETPYGHPPTVHNKRMQYSWMPPTRDRNLVNTCDDMLTEYIINVRNRVAARHKIGDVYLLGFSQGVGIAYDVATRHPDLFTGVIALAGILPGEEFVPADRLAAAKSLRILIGHGRQDPAVQAATSRQAHERLAALGYTVTLLEYDAGHEVPPGVLEKVARWLAGKDIAADEHKEKSNYSLDECPSARAE